MYLKYQLIAIFDGIMYLKYGDKKFIGDCLTGKVSEFEWELPEL